MFRHDRAKARREGRCLACGQSGHYRPECSLVSPENRGTQTEASDTSPKAGSPSGGKGSKGKAKAKAGAQAKGVTEDGQKAEVASGQCW